VVAGTNGERAIGNISEPDHPRSLIIRSRLWNDRPHLHDHGNLGVFTNSGIGYILIQRSRTHHVWVWPGFWIDLGLASIGAALVLIVAPLGADLYAVPEITGLASVIALSMPLSALSTIPLTLSRVSLNFRLLATVGTMEVVAGQSLSILLAWYGMGPYSFVIPLPIIAALKAIGVWTWLRPQMRRTRYRRAWWYLVTNGFWIWSGQLLLALTGQGGYLVLGLLASPEQVGLYFFALRLSGQSNVALVGNLYSVVLPILTRLRARPKEQIYAALKASESLAGITAFTACLQVALATPLLHLLFDDRWDRSIRLVQILSLALSFDAVTWMASALLAARGEFRKTFLCNLVATPWFFVFVGLGAWLDGAIGVAIAAGFYYAIYGPCYTYVAMPGVRSVLRLYVPPLALSGLAVFPANAIANLIAVRAITQVVVIVVVAAAFYAALLRMCMPRTFGAMRQQAAAVFRVVN
jgi:O-antigen/teichoic acid export membrane protein